MPSGAVAEAPAPRLFPDDVGPVERWCSRHASLASTRYSSVRAQRAVLCAVAWYVDRFGQGRAHPSVEQLMAIAQLSERAVQYALDALEDAGRLTRTLIAGRGKARLYSVAVGPSRGATLAPEPPAEPPEKVQPLRPSEPVEHAGAAALAPHVVGSWGSRELPPDPPPNEAEPATPAPAAQAPPWAGGARDVLCMRARRRGYPCASCRACGTNPRSAAAGATAARPARLRLTECASCQDPVRSSEPDPVWCGACAGAGHGPTAQLGLDGAAPGSDPPDGHRNGPTGPPRGRSGPYGPEASS